VARKCNLTLVSAVGGATLVQPFPYGAMQHDLVSTIACNLCGGTTVRALSQRSRSGQPLRTVGCRSCGLVWSDPRPHAARQYYEDEYRLDYKGTFEPKPKHVHRAGQVALSRLEKIRQHLRPRMRALDVGSGGGEFAYLLQTLGHDVQGIEPNRGYAAFAATEYGLNITRGFIGDTVLPDGGFDLITIWHVLEHTEDPTSVLAQLGRALAPEGLLVVEVPNVEATCQSPSSSFHEAHLYSFNTVTLQAMAARLGLLTHAITLSDDGGNVTAVFRADPNASDRHLRTF
jgi:2-polyprenyl-3-methyl-5-hydroxy-6-metoxy-1,4-benzoquinol methylase